MGKIIAIVMMLLVSAIHSDRPEIDTSKSYQVAGLTGDVSIRYNDPYYNNRRYYKRKRYNRNRYYKKRYYYPKRRYYKKKRYYKKRTAPRKPYRYVAPKPRMTDSKRIQKALQGLGFYNGTINGNTNSYATRSAIRKMNADFGAGNASSLNSESKNNLIFLGTQFILDSHLISTVDNRRAEHKRVQAALTIHGFYNSTIDGIKGSGTRKAISKYRQDRDMSYGTSLGYDAKYELISSAKKINDTSIEETINSLKNITNNNNSL